MCMGITIFACDILRLFLLPAVYLCCLLVAHLIEDCAFPAIREVLETPSQVKYHKLGQRQQYKVHKES